MFLKQKGTVLNDVASLFDSDFYNSAVIYNLPKVDTQEYTVTYRTREDLVSLDFYGDVYQYGLVLLSIGQTCHKENDEIVRDIEPLDIIKLKDYDGLTSYLSTKVTSNSLIQTSRSEESWRQQESKSYEYSDGRFQLRNNQSESGTD